MFLTQMTRIIAPKINLTKLKNLLVPNFQLNSPATEYLFPSPTNSITNKLIFTVPSRSISSISFFFQQSSRKKYLPFRSNTFCNPLQSFSTGAYSHCGQMFFSTEISKREGFFSKPGRKYYLILLGILFSIEAGAELFFLYKVPYSIHKFVIETLENNEILKDTLQSNQIEIRFLQVKYEKIVLRGDKEVIYRIPVKGNSGFGIARIHIKQINGEWKVNSLVVYKVSEMQMSSYRSLDVDSLDSITLVPEPLAIFGRKDSSLATHSIFWNKNKVSN